MAGTIDGHTSTLLAEGYSLDHVLGFHLAVRCFPPSGYMLATAKRAILRCRKGEPDGRVRLPEGMTHRRYGRLVPAREIVEGWNLWCFLSEDEDGEG